jgi:hypothetical protein
MNDIADLEDFGKRWATAEIAGDVTALDALATPCAPYLSLGAVAPAVGAALTLRITIQAASRQRSTSLSQSSALPPTFGNVRGHSWNSSCWLPHRSTVHRIAASTVFHRIATQLLVPDASSTASITFSTSQPSRKSGQAGVSVMMASIRSCASKNFRSWMLMLTPGTGHSAP